MSPSLIHPVLFLLLFSPIEHGAPEIEVQSVVIEQAEQAAEPVEQAATIPAPWGALADCESGEWDRHGDPIPNSRRWDYGAPGAFERPGYAFDGGLNFAASTWSWVAGDLGYLEAYPYAYEAPATVQVEVAQETQRRQGWGAWPICSQKIGLR